jgi:hypothetical protein
MKVLIIIPTSGDRPAMLAEAVASVEAQTVPTLCVVRQRYVDGVEIGFAERLNSAITESDCDAFAILADDDKLCPEFVEKTAAEMESRDVDIVYTNCKVFGDYECLGGATGQWTKENIDRNTVPLCTSLCRKSAWEKAGRFVTVPYYDWDFWWRCFYSGATAYWLKEPLFWWRDHAKGATRSEDHVESRRFILNRHKKLREQMDITA